MPDPSSRPPTTQVPGERRLAHPPSDRYRAAEPVAPLEGNATSPTRRVMLAVAASVLGAAVLIVLGGVLAVSAGLVVVAGATGWAVAAALRAGAGRPIPNRRRVGLAVALALAAVAVGQLGLWLYARAEGGVLGPLDYLGETFGLLVPLEVLAASIVGWATAR